jgi:hypothetical protein
MLAEHQVFHEGWGCPDGVGKQQAITHKLQLVRDDIAVVDVDSKVLVAATAQLFGRWGVRAHPPPGC